MNGELLVGIMGLFVAPLYYMVYTGMIKIEQRLTKIESQCVYCKSEKPEREDKE